MKEDLTLKTKEELIKLYENSQEAFKQVLKDNFHLKQELRSIKAKRKNAGRPKTIDDNIKKQVKKLHKKGISMKELSKQFDISVGSIFNIIHSKINY